MECFYTTKLSISGTKEEMVKALLKLRSFTEGDVTLGSLYMYMYRGAEKVSVDSLQTKEEIEAIIKDIISPLIIETDGPWGSFTKLYEIGLLKELADTIPFSSFKCHIEGGCTYDDQFMDCELKNQKMLITTGYRNYEDTEYYEEHVESIMPYTSFIHFLKITEGFDKADYELFIEGAECRSKFLFDTYEQFCNYFENTNITEKEYLQLQTQCRELRLDSDYFNEEVYDKKTEIYDPIEHIKIMESVKKIAERQADGDIPPYDYYQGVFLKDPLVLKIENCIIGHSYNEAKLKDTGLIDEEDIETNRKDEDWFKLVINKPVRIWNDFWRVGFYFEENNFIWTEISLYKSESDKMSYELIKEYAQKTFGTIHKLDDTEFVFGDEHNINAVRLVKNNSGWCLEV